MTGRGRGGRVLRDYGPVQLAARLGLTQFQVERARRLGLIPAPDVEVSRGGVAVRCRWSANVVDRLAANPVSVAEIRAAAGSVPDVGAFRAAVLLGERTGETVTADAVHELARRGLVPVAGEFRGAPLFDGQALERLVNREDVAEVVAAAEATGRCLRTDEAADYLRIRLSDFQHLVRAGRVEAARWVRSSWQRRSVAPMAALYRVADLDGLASNDPNKSDESIDWAAVRSTPPGRPSPLAALPDCPPAGHGPDPVVFGTGPATVPADGPVEGSVEGSGVGR